MTKKCVFDGDIKTLIEYLEDFLWNHADIDNNEDSLYISEKIATTFVHDNFKEENYDGNMRKV